MRQGLKNYYPPLSLLEIWQRTLESHSACFSQNNYARSAMLSCQFRITHEEQGWANSLPGQQVKAVYVLAALRGVSTGAGGWGVSMSGEMMR